MFESTAERKKKQHYICVNEEEWAMTNTLFLMPLILFTVPMVSQIIMASVLSKQPAWYKNTGLTQSYFLSICVYAGQCTGDK